MSTLILSLLGSFQAARDGQRIKSFRTSKVQALLILLATDPGEHSRERLTTLLWPGMPERSARHNLRQSLYHLRTIIPDAEEGSGAEPVSLILANRQSIELNPVAKIEVDILRFEALIDGTLRHVHMDLFVCPTCRHDLEAAVALYRGDFLADFYLEDSNEFEEWSQTRRETYRRKMLDSLEILTTLRTRHQEYGPAAELAQRQLEIDNLRESAYRQLMEILALNGRRSEALAVYDRCRRLLAEELGMAPSKRTTQIYDKIVAGDLRFDTPAEQGIRGYELADEIGSGAYGSIYRAVQHSVGREVAVKVIRRKYANDPEFVRRFEAEAQMVARIEHPYIVPLYDYWRDPEGAYLVMRYLRGGNLQTALKNGPWDLDQAARLLDQVAVALAAAHRAGVVHRDIKPANILLDETGNAFLTDFGIAKDLTGDMQLTGEGAVIGTPDYISPEQILNDPVTSQTDIYSLGAVLYEALTGEKPFPDSSVANLIYKHLHEPIPLVSDSRPGLPPLIDAVIQRATAKEPADRYATALEMAEAFRLAAMGEEAGAARAAEAILPLVGEVYNPYVGLRAFQEADADDFFGREALVQQIIARLNPSVDGRIAAAADPRFLALVGPSGSGKSSVVKAGLIPALRDGAIPGSEKWFVAEMTPGAYPLEELELALWPVAVDAPPSLVEPMRRDTRGMLRTIRRILPDEQGAQLLLIIDQFEELFTLVDDDQRRDFFLDSLLQALSSPRSPLRVVITLRADFYDRPLQYEALGRLLKQNTEIVLPLTSEELGWAIREPARRVGVRLEQGLAETIIADLADQPGSLPMLQYTLTELFERREEDGRGPVMSGQAYAAIGGVLGAIGRRAEEVYGGLNPAQQEATRQLFLRLVTLGEGTEDTRRRIPRAELEALAPALEGPNNGGSDTQADNLQLPIDAFGAARLLTFDHDPVSRGPTVEVAHEALLREWARLRGWLDQSRDDVRMQRLLAAAAREWQAAGRDPGYLLRQARLDHFAGWAATSSVALTGTESEFLQASVDAREVRQAEETARQQRELETAQKLAETEKARAEQEQVRAEEQTQAAGRLRQRAILLTGALFVAGILAIAAFFFAREANKNALEAQRNFSVARENADLASTREVVALAEADLRATAEADALAQKVTAEANEQEAISQQATAEAAQAQADQARMAAEEQAKISQSRELAAAALNNLDEDPERSILLAQEALKIRHTIEAESALHQAIQSSPLRLTLINEETGSFWLAASPDGRQAFVSGRGGGTMWDLEAGQIMFTHTVPPGDWTNQTAFTPDGELLLLTGESRDDDGEPLPSSLTIVNAQTGQEVLAFVAHDSFMQDVAISPDGALFATVSADLTTKIWDLQSILNGGPFEPLRTLCCQVDWWNFVEFSPDGQRLLVSQDDDTAKMWDVTTGQQLFSVGLGAGPLAFSPDGDYLVTAADSFPYLYVWDAANGELLSSARFGTTYVNSVSFSPDGSQIVTGWSGGKVVIWDFSPEGLQDVQTLLGHREQVGGAVFGPDGRQVISSSADGTIRIWDVSPTASGELGGFAALEIHGLAFPQDGSFVATGGGDGRVRIWDTTTWTELLSFQAHEDLIWPVAITADGSLLFTGSNDGTAKIWDTVTWQPLHIIEAHDSQAKDVVFSGVLSLALSPDGRLLATGGVEGAVRLWDVQSGELVKEMAGHSFRVQNIAFSPDGLLLASSSTEVNISNVSSGELLQTLTIDDWQTSNTLVYGLDFSPDGKQLVGGRADFVVETWRLPDAPWQDGDKQAELVREVESQVGIVYKTVYSPDGEKIAIAGTSGLVEIRDAGTGELLLGLQHPSNVWIVLFTPDGKSLITYSLDGVTRVLALDLDELQILAQSRVTRSLTDAECQQYLHLDACP